MREFTKEIRQEILDEYTARHGEFSPAGFLREVRASNGSHPAWSWFEWDDGKAAEEHRVWQSRMFVQGLKIKFEIETSSSKVSKIEVREAPAYLSPVDRRAEGGGYYPFDPSNDAHRQELARQASQSLETWMRRYGGIFELMGGNLKTIQKARIVLEGKKVDAA